MEWQWIDSRFWWLVPAVYAGGGCLALALRDGRRAAVRHWRIASFVAGGAALWSIAALLAAIAAALDGGARQTLIPASMLALVGVLGWIVLRFSRTYLDGESGQRCYVAAVLGALAAIAVVVTAGDLRVLWLGWVAASLALHRLLLFYPERPMAVMAAHKKFLAGRLAELCLLAAFALVAHATGSWAIGDLAARVAAAADPASLQAAALLLALGAALKTAQMPAHGWLMQVMEAPTPVSALLHAGVVNLGGYVLVRLAPLLDAGGAAQAVLLIVGGVTVLLASLAMSTRISIKVQLAWSTCAQMGFMLVECALGLYELAMLHLVAHSFYKAHAFLAAGGVVRDTRVRQLAGARSPLRAGAGGTLSRAVLAPAVGVAIAAISVRGWQVLGIAVELPWPWLVVIGLIWAPLLEADGRFVSKATVRGMLAAGLLTQLYLALHTVFAWAFAVTPATVRPLPMWIAAAGTMVALYALQAAMRMRPMPALRRWSFAGLYLDEWFTRWTFRLWPRALPRKVERSVTVAASSAIS